MGAPTALWLSVFSACLFVGISIALEFQFTKQQILYMFPKALVRVASMCLMYASLVVLPVGVVVSITAASSLIAICFFAPLRGESVSNKTIGYGLISFVGMFLITRNNLGSSLFVFDLKLLLPIGAMITGAYSLVLWRDSATQMHPIQNLAILHSWSALLSIPTVIAISAFTSQAIRPDGSTMALFIIVAFAAIGDMLFVKAQHHVSLTTNGLLFPAGTIFTTIFAMIFFGQIMQWWQWIGMVIIVSSVAASTLTTKRISYVEPEVFQLVEPAGELQTTA